MIRSIRRQRGASGPRLLVALAVLLLLAVLVWLAVRASTAPSATPVDSPATTPDDDPQPRRERGAERRRDPEPAAPAPGAAAVEPPEVLQAAPEAPAVEAPGALVRVVYGADFEPAPDALVAHQPFDESVRMGRSDADAVDALVESGQRLALSGDGTGRLPAGTGPTVLVARRGNARAMTYLLEEPPDDAEIELELTEVRTILCVVETADGGRASGCEVQLLLATSCTWDRPLARGTTDAEGIVQLTAWLPWTPPEKDRMLAVLPMTSNPRVEQIVPPDHVPGTPIALHLPATGSVTCEIVDPEHGPRDAVDSPDSEVVHLWNAQTIELGGTSADLDGDKAARAGVVGGFATFLHVPLGAEFEARLSPPGDRRLSTRARFAGPTTSGETVRVKLVRGGLRPLVKGRIVTPTGEPVVGQTVFGELLLPGRRAFLGLGQDFAATTDSGGRFSASVDRPLEEIAGRHLQLRHRLERDGRVFMRERTFAEAQLPATATDGEFDLGQVVLGSGILLVSGTVRDPSGQPVPGATVAAMRQQSGWRSALADLNIDTTDEQGRFTLRGEIKGQEVLLGVSAPGWFPDAVPRFKVGSTDVEVVLARAGAIEGSFKSATGPDGPRLRFVLRGAAADNNGTESQQDGELEASFGGPGRFEFPSLRPGEATFEIYAGWNNGDKLLEIDGVLVEAGRVTRDPRLEQIDLAALLNVRRVTVVDDADAPLADVEVHFRRDDIERASWQSVRTDSAGVADVGSGGASVSVSASVPGFASELRTGVTEDVRLELRRTRQTTVEIVLGLGTALPELPHGLEATLDWLGPLGSTHELSPRSGPAFSTGPHMTFDTSRRVAVRTWTPGRYRVSVMMWTRRLTGSTGGNVATVPEPTVVVVPGDGTPIEVTIEIDPEQLEWRMSRADK